MHDASRRRAEGEAARRDTRAGWGSLAAYAAGFSRCNLFHWPKSPAAAVDEDPVNCKFG